MDSRPYKAYATNTPPPGVCNIIFDAVWGFAALGGLGGMMGLSLFGKAGKSLGMTTFLIGTAALAYKYVGRVCE